jgi:hypothetical protein
MFLSIMTTTMFSTLIAAAPVMAGTRSECAELRAFNDRQPSQSDTTLLPCRCIPVSERADKVYPPDDAWPSGFRCGNHVFYDKQCHLGVTCYPK